VSLESLPPGQLCSYTILIEDNEDASQVLEVEVEQAGEQEEDKSDIDIGVQISTG
jgi:hypothetical protein